MRVRQLIAEKKFIQSETRWSTDDLPPRHAPIYQKTRPIRGGWKWRSAKAHNAEGVCYTLIVMCNPSKDNWKAMLVREADGGATSVVSRFEHHASHPGLHAHAHCQRSGIEIGPSSLDNLARVPDNHKPHRRVVAWTESTFWEASKRFFHIETNSGPLFTHAS